MKTKNDLIQLCLLCAAMLPAVAQAQLAFTTNNGAITINGCYGSTNNVKIPDIINNHPVVSIADWAIWPSGMTNVTIPASVTNIGYAAFYYYPNLMSFTVNGNNTNYASAGGVLFNKPMTTLIQCPMALTGGYGIPSSVINIGTNAFQSCSHLTSVTIPNSVTNISDSAFNNCSGLTNVVIPDSVTNIGYSAFDFCSSIRSVTIGTNVTSIGGYAFANCTGLTNATLGSGVISIGIDAFESCSALKSVVIPNSVTNIGNYAFDYCSSLASLTLGTNVISIGQYAFMYSSLTSVSLPGSVASIGDFAFGGCSDLNNFNVDGGNPYYASAGGVLFNRTMTTLVEYPCGRNGGYTIPNGVTNIGNYAFDYCSGLTGVTIPVGVTGFGISAFGFCSGLTSITIPATVTNIGKWAFSYCSSLTSIKIPNSVSSIGYGAFYDCESLTRATIGNGVTSIGQYAFEYCTSLHQVRFMGNAPSAGNWPGSTDNTVFEGETGTAYYTVNTTGWDTSFGGWPTALYSSPAEDFTYVINSGTITITGYIGSDSDVTVPLVINGHPVTAISDQAFYNQTNLTSVTILANVTILSNGAFADCSNLTSIIVDTTNPSYASSNGVLFNKTMTTLIQYPAGLSGGYVISNGVSSVGNEAFENCSGLTNVVIGNSVTNIGNEAFNGCVGLTSVTLSGNVTSIGDGAFGNCSNLTSVTIPASVTNVGVGAFAHCSSLIQAYFLGDAPGVNGADGSADNSVFAGETGTAYYFSGTARWGTTFGGWPAVALIDPATVFTFITNADNTLTITGYIGTNSDISIPAAINGFPVTLIGDNAFYNQTNLTSVAMADSVSIVGDSAFSGCSSLTNVTMGNGVTNIGQNAFNSCSLLSSVTIPDSVTRLGISAFYNCSGLMNAIVGNGVTSIGNWAFYNCYSLTNVTIGNHVTSIDAEAFNSCSGLANVTMPNSVTNIGDWAFADCYGLTNVTLGNGVISIGYFTFGWCSSLTSVTIPAGVTSIGAAAFGGCDSMTNIAVDAANPGYTSAGGVLFNESLTSLVEYPAGLAGSYVIPDGVTNIGESAFEDCSGLTSVTVPASVTSVGGAAFYWCYSLTNFTVNTYNPIYASTGGVLFNNAMTLLVEYPAGLAGSYVIPNGVTNICVSAFVGCSILTSVTIPTTIKSIGDSTFEYCYGLTNVLIPCGVTNIGNLAFADCYDLTSVTLPASVTSIGVEAFEYCSSLHQAYFLGDAPIVNGGAGSADTSVFEGESGIVYYASDTSGWEATFGGWPTAAGSYQCKPQILGSGGGLGMRNNQFQFTISWAANTIVVVEACTDLANPVWCPMATNTLNGGSACFSDPQCMNYPVRYYRIRSQ